MFILGGFAISSGLLTIAFLPETLGAGLPEVTSNKTKQPQNSQQNLKFWASLISILYGCQRSLPQFFKVLSTSGPWRHRQLENQLKINVDLRQTQEEELVLLHLYIDISLLHYWQDLWNNRTNSNARSLMYHLLTSVSTFQYQTQTQQHSISF